MNFSIELNQGMLLDAPGKVGVAYLTAQMLNEGTASKTPEQLEEAIGQLGASIRVACSRESMTLSGLCLKKNFARAMELVEEMLLHPRWDEQSFAVVKERAIDNVRQRATEPEAIAQSVFDKALYGTGSVLSENPSGTEASLQSITLDDLKAFYDECFSPKVARMSFVGGFTQSEVEKSLASLTGNWPAKDVRQPEIGEDGTEPAGKVLFVDYPGARQSYVLIGSKAMPMRSPEAYPAVIVNDKLGASSGSLLFEILRLQHGYTYGAYSHFVQGNYYNNFQALSSVQAIVTEESVALFRDILSSYGADYSQEFLDRTRQALLRTMNGSFETPAAQLAMLRKIALYGLADDYVKRNEQTLKDMTLGEAKQVIGQYIDFDRMTIVIVGDAKTQLAGVRSLGLGDLVVVDSQGRPVK